MDSPARGPSERCCWPSTRANAPLSIPESLDELIVSPGLAGAEVVGESLSA